MRLFSAPVASAKGEKGGGGKKKKCPCYFLRSNGGIQGEGKRGREGEVPVSLVPHRLEKRRRERGQELRIATPY